MLKIDIFYCNFQEIDAVKLIFAACDSLKYCFFVLGDVLRGKMFVCFHDQLNCTMHTAIEFAYYAEAAKGTRKDLYCYCASADFQKGPKSSKEIPRGSSSLCELPKKGLEIPKETL